jgi:asparagine synthase (glutamine-hydrolysing)
MCGICGVISPEQDSQTRKSVLRTMTSLLRHRGPDGLGYYHDRRADLGVRRLAIIDLVTGDQPISNEDGTIHVVFNGEIYNFRQLRSQLEARGHQFKTTGDTEVIVHAYEEFGPACLEQFNGMFAFALWDQPRERLVLARDRIGIKPLYYWFEAGLLVFASELRAVIAHPRVPREIDPIALDQFLTLEYIPGPRTIFKGIFKLEPGHYLTLEAGELRDVEYWDLRQVPVPTSEQECAEQLFALLDDAVQLRLVSDVPLGTFLSGGIDSSTVLCLMSRHQDDPVRSFSIGFDDQTYNELPWARQAAEAFGAEHHEKVLNPDLHALALRLGQHLDEPIADFSIFPTFLVSELARHQVTVAMSGDGGDEVFGGYDTYRAERLSRYYALLPGPVRLSILPDVMARIYPRPAKKGIVNMARRFVQGAAMPPELQHTRWMMFLTEADKKSLYQPGLLSSIDQGTLSQEFEERFNRAGHRDSLAQQQYVDIKSYLPDNILAKVDRMSMAVSLEARVPFLDHRVVEFAWSLPESFKMRALSSKSILRKAMMGHLPASVLSKPKQGFSIPIKHWLRGPLLPLMMELLAPDRIRQGGYFEAACVERWKAEHLHGQENHSHRLWALMVLELWSGANKPQAVVEADLARAS